MTKVLIAECIQEISSFNPKPSGYENFFIQRGSEVLAQRGEESAIGGALKVFDRRNDIEVVPAYAANAESAGLLSADGWLRLSNELLEHVAPRIEEADCLYLSLHGAMAASGELDPEGMLLEQVRRLAGPSKPIVISLDLHGILTDRMLRQVDGVVAYHTYPHVDIRETGERAAQLLLDIHDRRLRPVITRIVIPALVRGDELITRTGCYGDLIREVRRLEGEGAVLAGGILIGNPFTDVPELCSQVVLVSSGEAESARATEEAKRLAGEFWALRFRMQGKLIPLAKAVAQAKMMPGPVAFTDAADAPSSGASGDSNAVIRALHAEGYRKRVLGQILDPVAAAAAHKAGVGATVEVSLGGTVDPRFQPMKVTATVETLTRGLGRYESWPGIYDAGRTAVLTFDNFTIVVISRPVALVDRSLYYASGLDPQKFDLVVIKSPHCEYQMFDAWVEKDFNVDAPGSTSANVKSLGHTICQRPMYPLDDLTDFEPKAVAYKSGLHAGSVE